MRLLVLIWMMVVGGAAWAADAGSCYAISDSDARALCLARARGDVGMCYAVQDSALRSACLAELRR